MSIDDNKIIPTGNIILEGDNYRVDVDKENAQYLLVNKKYEIVEVAISQLPAIVEALVHFEKAIVEGEKALDAFKRTQEFARKPNNSNVVQIKH